ncbi:manganese-dependent ADP-ribose/CDP-alcohol diphosphatase-like [Hyla sarda]|uniref:manganese-dependent ADP-ribose/CDP-alcohol diphosphatase-like n=1 Tax=Hyla sarda TaxID=327740 RepID=UPI0024C44A1B|nr:manganese-dependent ADP-ribose/CDP-alcohol diphosphatase-like [Hyla sarda]XP_056405472.1 manganese-dependent ADP-ribose/CDP-alcohol diphosphatase-like [Hyla sarda]XP_056405473.1 manganese-dependent ADP-ribose/CDP-alcohol diphosphatase-like [Hyla sarda]XP_056405474.1 manganese-dependent ADP-ribose/CDP-alcohol diphosphatase-like [Hyla sarda]
MAEARGNLDGSSRHGRPCFTFGVIADIQYADKADGPSCWKTMRYYSQSCLHLQDAIKRWNAEDIAPKFVLQLGDIIDCFNKRAGMSEASLQKILTMMMAAKMPFHHVWGNHEFYNFSRDYLMASKLNTSCLEDTRIDSPDQSPEGTSEGDYYAYHFSPYTKFRFIVVDTYDLSTIGRELNSDGLRKSLAFLDNNQSNCNGFHLLEFNGGMGKEQLAWLNDVLTYSDKKGERVIIAGHIPVHPKAIHSLCLAWNYDEILRTIQSHQSVVCYFAGHDHNGGYHLDSHGIHHITMEGVIESPSGSNAFGTVYVYEDGFILRGRGRVRDRYLPYRMAHKANSSSCTSSGASLGQDNTLI